MKLTDNFEFMDDDGNPVDPKTAIRRLRREHGWSTKDMAGICGVSYRTVENWEQGLRKPAKSVRLLLKRYF